MKMLSPFLSLFLLFLGATVAYAGSQGSTVVPNIQSQHMSSGAYTSTYINVSNITGKDVTCTIRLYDTVGNDVGDLTKVYKGSGTSSDSILVSEGKTFTLPAHATYLLSFYKQTPHLLTGYAVIEWESADNTIVKALVAGVKHLQKVNSNAYGISFGNINNGQPF